MTDLELEGVKARKEDILARLSELQVPTFKTHAKKKLKSNHHFSVGDAIVPQPETGDTHWDFMLKEMKWLSTDFTSERQRHVTLRKKTANAVQTYFEKAQVRHQRQLQDAFSKRRKRAAKLGRDVLKHYWNKLDRIIGYKQKIVHDSSKQTAMNQQLVKLVQLTERYNRGLLIDDKNNETTNEIEAALQQPARTSRRLIRDYVLLDQSTEDEQQWSDGTDESYEENSSDASSDDETTLQQAEWQETHQIPYQANPEELRLLHEEATMTVQEVVERLQQQQEPSSRVVRFNDENNSNDQSMVEEDDAMESSNDTDSMDDDDDEFAVPNPADLVDDERTLIAEEQLPPEMDPDSELTLLQQENELSLDELRQKYAVPCTNPNDNGHEPPSENNTDYASSDNNSDSSDLEADDEFEPPQREVVDDETTMIAEERLGRDMSYQEEIDLLNRESSMSVEELRRLYAGMDNNGHDDNNSGSEAAVDEEMEVEPEQARPSSQLSELWSHQNQENDDAFVLEEDPVDDETTIEAEERLGPTMGAQDEIALLQREGELPIEELRKLYASNDTSSDNGNEPASRKRPRDGNDADNGTDSRQRVKTDKADDDDGVAAMVRLEASAEQARQSMVTRPFFIPKWVKLREYQQIGLNWLVSLQSRRLNGILADEMGLGKTLQTIALLGYLACFKGIWGPHLIVVPTSVMLNWETELKRFCPALKVLCYYGTAKRRKELRTGWTKPNTHHVVITSYQLVVQDAFAFKRKRWYYLVLDEAQHIKNFQSQRWQTLINFNTQRRLLLTGTPLQNSLMELWSLLHFLMPYIFRSRKEFSYWFANPMNSMIEGGSNQNEDVVNRLHGIIRPFVLRRLKKDVETQLPGKFEHIMYIYEEFMARSSTRQALKKDGNFMGMMNVLMQLRKVCNHPDLFEPRSVVTPFVVDPIVMHYPACVAGMADEDCNTSASVPRTAFLWTGSSGVPSMEDALLHDTVASNELLSLEATLSAPEKPLYEDFIQDGIKIPTGVQELMEEVIENEYTDKRGVVESTNAINSSRCRALPFPYNKRLVSAVLIPKTCLQADKSDYLSSPAQLLSFRRSQQDRADDISGLIKRFVFAVPKAGGQSPEVDVRYRHCSPFDAQLKGVFHKRSQEWLEPFRDAEVRLSSFFPDKNLVQFDSGKLQTLAWLLRERKRGGHKVLIFTQMSKMLDILESFLNLNGHTYLRLDGGTSVDRRQRLMDRFNNDPKVFCFILSTRSGGVGINLTGADTVVFFDSDWNPAQDAQAQDRAHRIGQTREVHIFRLITERTIEENILLKAQQKRNLDILVMDKGQFDASQLQKHGKIVEASQKTSVASDVYSKGGLRAILGAPDEETTNDNEKESALSSEQIENTMLSLEDDDDVVALKGVRKEADEELKEFDETVEYKKDSDADDEEETQRDKPEETNNPNEKDKSDEKELEREIAAWQDKVGMDAGAIEASLKPVERYGLRFHEDVDPYYSVFAVLEHERKLAEEEEQEEDVDLVKIEEDKEINEVKAFEDGDLLGTIPDPEDLIRHRTLYQRERARLTGMKRRRKLTGEDWELRVEPVAKYSYWYNIDTGEARWDKPKEILEMEAYDLAYQQRWTAMPTNTLVHLFSFLPPFPDRMSCARVCSGWRRAASDVSYIRHVYPVELGAYTREDSKMEHLHYRSIDAAIKAALPGDTIELGDGHYWLNSDLVVDVPIRLIGDEHNPTNVVIEMNGTVIWRARGGFFEGILFRRQKLAANGDEGELLRVEDNARLGMIQCSFDNGGGAGPVVSVEGPREMGEWTDVSIFGGGDGIRLSGQAKLDLKQVSIHKNAANGVVCSGKSKVKLYACTIRKNGANGLDLSDGSSASIIECQFIENGGKLIQKSADCRTECRKCICTRSDTVEVAPRGFKFEN